MKLRNVLLVFAIVAFMSGCAAQAATPVTGFLYSDVQAPVDVEGDAEPVREGESCATSILGLIATGDASIHAAMAEGGISRVATVDYASSGILGIYAEFCTVVRGE